MTFDKFFRVLPLGLFFLLVTLPMLQLPNDMWDGVLIEYAALTKDFSGFLIYSVESTWFLQYPLGLMVITFAEVFGISYVHANAILILLLMSVLLRETSKLAQEEIGLSKLAAYFASILVAVFSTWGDLFSSLLSLHFGCVAIGFFAIRVIHRGSIAAKITGFIALLASFSLASQLVFLPILSYIYDLSDKRRARYLLLARPSAKTIAVVAFSFIFFITVRSYFAPHGLYENYNNLVFDNITETLIAAVRGILFATYLAPIVALVFLLSLSTVVIGSPQASASLESGYDRKWLVWLLLLFLAGAFPYIAVGKASFLGDVREWTGRQAFLLAVPTALFTACYLESLYEQTESRITKNIVIAGGAAIVVLHAALLSFASVYKLNRQLFAVQLERVMKINEDRLKPGLLEIVGDGIPGPAMYVYESNFLMFKATGKASWWTRVGNEPDSNFAIPCFIQKEPDYRLSWIYNFDPAHIGNHTVVTIRVNGFKTPLGVVRNLFGRSESGQVELVSINQLTTESSKTPPICT